MSGKPRLVKYDNLARSIFGWLVKNVKSNYQKCMLSTLGVAPASNSAKWWFIGIPGSKNVILLMVTVTARGPHPMYFLAFLFRPMATVVGDTSLVFTHLQGLSGSDSQGGLYESDNFQTKKIMHHASSCVRLFLAVLYPGFLCVFLGKNQRKVPMTPGTKVLASTDEKSAKQRWVCMRICYFCLLQKEMMQGIT